MRQFDYIVDLMRIAVEDAQPIRITGRVLEVKGIIIKAVVPAVKLGEVCNLRNPDGSYQSDFDLGDVIVGATWTGLSDRWPVRVVGDYVRNFGAINSQDTGYGLDLAVGRASAAGDWRVTYGYSVAESESVLAAFSHDNIALATNYRLHALTFDYVPMPKTLLSAIWYHYEPYASVDATGWIDRIRLAFTVTF